MDHAQYMDLSKLAKHAKYVPPDLGTRPWKAARNRTEVSRGHGSLRRLKGSKTSHRSDRGRNCSRDLPSGGWMGKPTLGRNTAIAKWDTFLGSGPNQLQDPAPLPIIHQC